MFFRQILEYGAPGSCRGASPGLCGSCQHKQGTACPSRRTGSPCWQPPVPRAAAGATPGRRSPCHRAWTRATPPAAHTAAERKRERVLCRLIKIPLLKEAKPRELKYAGLRLAKCCRCRTNLLRSQGTHFSAKRSASCKRGCGCTLVPARRTAQARAARRSHTRTQATLRIMNRSGPAFTCDTDRAAMRQHEYGRLITHLNKPYSPCQHLNTVNQASLSKESTMSVSIRAPSITQGLTNAGGPLRNLTYCDTSCQSGTSRAVPPVRRG